LGVILKKRMVSYNTLVAMKEVSESAFASMPAAVEITISWHAAQRHYEQPSQHAAPASAHDAITLAEEKEIPVQHHHFRYASRKNKATDNDNTTLPAPVNYGMIDHVRSIEFRSEMPLIIGGVPLCSAFTPINLGRFVPDGAQVEVEISIEGIEKTRASFIYSSTATNHTGITISPQGAMEFGL
jgi:hypothetical protein